LASSVIDAYSPLSIIRRQRWAQASALSRALSILGCGGAGTASESMVLRPPRIVIRIMTGYGTAIHHGNGITDLAEQKKLIVMLA
jgi:hypothetical protein